MPADEQTNTPANLAPVPKLRLQEVHNFWHWATYCVSLGRLLDCIGCSLLSVRQCQSSKVEQNSSRRTQDAGEQVSRTQDAGRRTSRYGIAGASPAHQIRHEQDAGRTNRRRPITRKCKQTQDMGISRLIVYVMLTRLVESAKLNGSRNLQGKRQAARWPRRRPELERAGGDAAPGVAVDT